MHTTLIDITTFPYEFELFSISCMFFVWVNILFFGTVPSFMPLQTLQRALLLLMTWLSNVPTETTYAYIYIYIYVRAQYFVLVGIVSTWHHAMASLISAAIGPLMRPRQLMPAALISCHPRDFSGPTLGIIHQLWHFLQCSSGN